MALAKYKVTLRGYDGNDWGTYTYYVYSYDHSGARAAGINEAIRHGVHARTIKIIHVQPW